MFEVRDSRLILHSNVLYCRHHGEINDRDGREDGGGGPTVSLGRYSGPGSGPVALTVSGGPAPGVPVPLA